jgi:hypothetical protein
MESRLIYGPAFLSTEYEVRSTGRSPEYLLQD